MQIRHIVDISLLIRGTEYVRSILAKLLGEIINIRTKYFYDFLEWGPKLAFHT